MTGIEIISDILQNSEQTLRRLSRPSQSPSALSPVVTPMTRSPTATPNQPHQHPLSHPIHTAGAGGGGVAVGGGSGTDHGNRNNSSLPPRSPAPPLLSLQNPFSTTSQSHSQPPSQHHLQVSTSSSSSNHYHPHHHNTAIIANELTSLVEGTTSQLRQCVKNISNTNAFMLMTINRCIDYTKASRGLKLIPKMETIDLSETIQLPLECMKNIQEKIQIFYEPTTLPVTTNTVSDTPWTQPVSTDICSHIITDKQWLQENLLCLLSNAVKYSNDGIVNISVYLTQVEKPKTTSTLKRFQSRRKGGNGGRGGSGGIGGGGGDGKEDEKSDRSYHSNRSAGNESSGGRYGGTDNTTPNSTIRLKRIMVSPNSSTGSSPTYHHHHPHPHPSPSLSSALSFHSLNILRHHPRNMHPVKIIPVINEDQSMKDDISIKTTSIRTKPRKLTGDGGVGDEESTRRLYRNHEINDDRMKFSSLDEKKDDNEGEEENRERTAGGDEGGGGGLVSFSPTRSSSASCKTVTIDTGIIVGRNDRNGIHLSSSSPFRPTTTTATTKPTVVPAHNSSKEYITHIRFDIEDHGIGMSSEAMSQLFSPFKQAQRLVGGTGLGLYSLAKRVEALKGCYGVSSRNDGKQGSLFWFSIPYRPDRITAELISQATARGGGAGGVLSRYNSCDDNGNPGTGTATAAAAAAAMMLKDHRQRSSSSPLSTSSAVGIGGGCGDGSSNQTHQQILLDRNFHPILQQQRVLSEKYDHQPPSSTTFSEESSPVPFAFSSRNDVPITPNTSPMENKVLSMVPSSLHILIVDDVPSIIKMISMLLKRQGHHIQSAENGQIALNKIQKQWEETKKGFDVILMDLQMPVMDGLEATRRLRKMEIEGRDWMKEETATVSLSHNDNVEIFQSNDLLDDDDVVGEVVKKEVTTLSYHHAVIGVSANSDHETACEAHRAGVDAFMAKPFSMDLFNMTVLKVLQMLQERTTTTTTATEL
jgi:CheY-like chemotaxis protein/signal transduction histidine kinase